MTLETIQVFSILSVPSDRMTLEAIYGFEGEGKI
jgi:hypothetical protein